MDQQALWAGFSEALPTDGLRALDNALVLSDFLEEAGCDPDTLIALRWMYRSGRYPFLLTTEVWWDLAAKTNYRQPYGQKPTYGQLGWYWMSAACGSDLAGGPICYQWHEHAHNRFRHAALPVEVFASKASEVLVCEKLSDSVAWLGQRLRTLRDILALERGTTEVGE